MNNDKQFEYNMDTTRQAMKTLPKEALEARINAAALDYAISCKRSDYKSMALLYTIIIDTMEALFERYQSATVSRLAKNLYIEYKKD